MNERVKIVLVGLLPNKIAASGYLEFNSGSFSCFSFAYLHS